MNATFIILPELTLMITTNVTISMINYVNAENNPYSRVQLCSEHPCEIMRLFQDIDAIAQKSRDFPHQDRNIVIICIAWAEI